MNPSSLLHVSPELMREHVRLGMPDAPMAEANDRSWCFWVCAALAALAGGLILVLR